MSSLSFTIKGLVFKRLKLLIFAAIGLLAMSGFGAWKYLKARTPHGAKVVAVKAISPIDQVQTTDQLESILSSNLINPETVHFQKLTLYRGRIERPPAKELLNDAYTLCGEFSAQPLYGDTSKYQRFFASAVVNPKDIEIVDGTDMATTEGFSSDEITEFSSRWNKICFPVGAAPK